MSDVKLNLTVAGLPQELLLTAGEVQRVYRPVLSDLVRIHQAGRRTVAILAGPPGSGKSTFAAALEALSLRQGPPNLTILPMDGFHFPNAYLKTHFIEREGVNLCLADIKGAPESFDLARLGGFLKQLIGGETTRWPVYDRGRHDVVEDALEIPAEGIFIIEGNYLLLDEPGWRELPQLAHRRMFITAPEEHLIARLIDRHVRGGKDPQAVREWVMRTDRANIRRVITHALAAEMRIVRDDRPELDLEVSGRQ